MYGTSSYLCLANYWMFFSCYNKKKNQYCPRLFHMMCRLCAIIIISRFVQPQNWELYEKMNSHTLVNLKEIQK